MKGTLHEDHYTFFIISRSFVLRMRSIADESCRENQNTHFGFGKVFFFFSKIVPIMRKCGKVLYSGESHR